MINIGDKATLVTYLILMRGAFIDPTVKSARTAGIAAAILAARRSYLPTFRLADAHVPAHFNALPCMNGSSRYHNSHH
jgi:hypothetical protein